MNTTTLQVPLSKTLKQEATETAREHGFSSLQELVRVLLTKFARRDLTISVTKIKRAEEEEELSDYAISMLKQAEEDRKAGKASPIFNTGKEAVKWLKDQGI